MWMMAPMMATRDGQAKVQKESGWTFWKELETADTPQEHHAIAESYRRDAEDYRLQAKEHERIKTVYQDYKDKPGMDEVTAEFMVIHCQRLVEKFSKLADEMESLARQHELIAEKIAENQGEGAK
jgi:hypothetical protein